jgi:hypothetical protein
MITLDITRVADVIGLVLIMVMAIKFIRFMEDERDKRIEAYKEMITILYNDREAHDRALISVSESLFQALGMVTAEMKALREYMTLPALSDAKKATGYKGVNNYERG